LKYIHGRHHLGELGIDGWTEMIEAFLR